MAGAATAAPGRSPRLPAVARNVLGGAVARGVTYGIGSKSLETTPPDWLIGDLRELPALLDGKGRST